MTLNALSMASTRLLVRIEDQNAVAVLKHLQNDRQDVITLEVFESSLLEKYVGLIAQDNISPGLTEMEDRFEISLNHSGLGTNITARGRVERLPRNLVSEPSCWILRSRKQYVVLD